MEKGNKKRNTPEIDEEYVMSLMAGGVRKEGMQQPPEEPPKEEIKEEIIKQLIGSLRHWC